MVDGLISCHAIHGVQISEAEVLLAGNSSADTYRVDLIKNKCVKDSPRVSSSWINFSMAPVIIGGSAYFTDNSRAIHIYRMKERKWEKA